MDIEQKVILNLRTNSVVIDNVAQINHAPTSISKNK